MSSLPEEIYLDILLRVPVRSAFVCKCVCKCWFQLISDPDFVKIHLNRTTITQTNNSSVMFKSGDAKNVYSISYDSLLHESDDNDFIKMDFPYKSLKRIELLGSCNGVVYFWSHGMQLYFLWNPATKEYKKLPKLGTKYSYLRRCYHGFGYDYVADDYKLVELFRNEETTSVQVYSLKSNSWKSLQPIHYKLRSHRAGAWFLSTRALSGLFFNGSLHWFGGIDKEASSTMIISMDIHDERFKEILLPTTLAMTLSKTHSYIVDMGVLEGYLCVHSYGNDSFEVWVMLDHGVAESWTKFHTITPDITVFTSCFYLTSFKNGEILFNKARGLLILCDPKFGNFRKINIHHLDVGSAVSYFESLVSLNSTTAVGRGKNKESTTNLRRSRGRRETGMCSSIEETERRVMLDI
ncbi:F-box/kelch-repeat protein At3g06240-like [Papaver somniferum]|uniref:F-box/kelch-repeat protein At3g06240-like n=1 Tax=Papaver somniferum TaxID=3469 RepID=UPI000E6F6A7C|nr:F-box/kelch-repeat protein At3g06240-like [Papaver somniferum]